MEAVVRLLAEDMGFTLRASDINYFDFRYPQATNLKLVADSVETNRWQENFQIAVPKRLTIYEYSWAHAILDDKRSGYLASSNCQRNGADFSWLQPLEQGLWRFALGTFTESETLTGTTENFFVKIAYESNGYCGIALVY